MEEGKFNLLKDLYEQAFEREENRKNIFEQKSSNLVGFTGATVGIFIGTLTPILLSKELLMNLSIRRTVFVFWIISIIAFLCGIIFFILLLWRWHSLLSPRMYMANDPSSLLNTKDIASMRENYINDLERSVNYNQERINELGSQFMGMISFVKLIVICFFITVYFHILCKLNISLPLP